MKGSLLSKRHVSTGWFSPWFCLLPSTFISVKSAKIVSLTAEISWERKTTRILNSPLPATGQRRKKVLGWEAGCNHPCLCCFRLCYHSAGCLGKGEGKREELCLVPHAEFAKPATSYSCLAISPISWIRFGSDSRLSICPTFLPSHSKISGKFKHIKCLNWLFHSW